jgi:hypothetical protein
MCTHFCAICIFYREYCERYKARVAELMDHDEQLLAQLYEQGAQN